MNSARLGPLFAAGLGSAVHGAAYACAVCGGGKAANEAAYYDMTIFMSLFPLGLIGAVVGAVYYLSLDGRSQATQDESPVVVPEPRPTMPTDSAGRLPAGPGSAGV